MRVADFLATQQVPYETLLHPPAFTAQKRARFLHVPGRRVAKAVLLHGPSGFVLAVLSALAHVNTDKLSRFLGEDVRLATDDEIAEVFNDCEWGVVPPFGTLYGLPVLLDDEIEPDTMMIFETDSHAEAVRMLCRDFEQLEQTRRVHLAR
jgi:Ala-tRNA(Pro) deacylase